MSEMSCWRVRPKLEYSDIILGRTFSTSFFANGFIETPRSGNQSIGIESDEFLPENGFIMGADPAGPIDSSRIFDGVSSVLSGENPIILSTFSFGGATQPVGDPLATCH